MVAVLPASLEIQAARARNSFAIFAKEAWHIIEPGKAYVGNWHLEAIAEHLQAVLEGDIKRLLVNMPPRHGKSSYISTLIHPWSWLHNPSLRWLCASYALNLATRDNLKCRRIIKSPWFQDRYGSIFTLTKDQDAKMKFENDKSGYRQAVSVGSAGTTGEGGDILLIDDPHPIEQKRSDLTARPYSRCLWLHLGRQHRPGMGTSQSCSGIRARIGLQNVFPDVRENMARSTQRRRTITLV